MPVPWAALAAISGIISAGSSIFGAGQRRLQAQTQGTIGASQRRTRGVREIGGLALGATLSGVEVSDPNVAKGSERIGYSKGKAGFLGIGRKEGGKIRNARDYSKATDTTSITLGTSRDATRLDVSAIELGTENAMRAYGIEGFSAGLSTFARTAGALDTFFNYSGIPQQQPGGGTKYTNRFQYFGSRLGE